MAENDHGGIEMKRYFVKLTSTAKDNNPNFAGEVGVYYYGKGEELIKTEGTHLSDRNRDWMSIKGMEFGYKRECDEEVVDL